jgi:hypothetical protein
MESSPFCSVQLKFRGGINEVINLSAPPELGKWGESELKNKKQGQQNEDCCIWRNKRRNEIIRHGGTQRSADAWTLLHYLCKSICRIFVNLVLFCSRVLGIESSENRRVIKLMK